MFRLNAFPPRLSALLVLLLCGNTLPLAEVSAADRAGEEFFEKTIRPILVEHCQECHGAGKQQGEVRLDARNFVFDRDDGALVTAGQPGESRLLQVIKYDPYDTQMPPDGKLPQAAIDAFEKWIADGAAWPESDVATDGGSAGPLSIEQARQSHWSVQPVQRPLVPETVAESAHASPATPIDRFLLQKLHAAGLSYSPPVDRARLIRRAMVDLWGVAPTADEVEEFVSDDRPDAYERLIDRLLASPRYGQRWARHWLDIARYADTKGYVFTEEPRYPFAYTYRDYVVNALNDDLPYDRFIIEQLAADQAPQPGRENESLAALGFLTVGRRFLNNTHDIIDDRIDVVSRGLLGLTVTCARCHDHKYDPIPTADYYSLYGVFASVHEPEDLPVLGDPTQAPNYAAYKAEREKRIAARDEYAEGQRKQMQALARIAVGDYLLALAAEAKTGAVDEKPTYEHGDLIRGLTAQWKRYLNQRNSVDDPIFGPWNRFSKLKPDEFAAQFEPYMAAAERPSLNPMVDEAFRRHPPANVTELARRYGQLFAQSQRIADGRPESMVDEAWTFLLAHQDSPAWSELRAVLEADNSPVMFDTEQAVRMFRRDQRNKYRELEKQIAQWDVTSPDAPPRAMIVAENENPYHPVVFERGNPGRRGEAVQRRFLQVLSEPDEGVFQNGSGRLELAQAIASPDNPLTARVIVNRVWMHHFGEGLVRTPSDFGTRGEPPTHPELLDYLAAEFIRNGWSLKWLHRQMLLTDAYQQDSVRHAEGNQADPENRLLWRMNPQRMNLEAMRDSILRASGVLDEALGGRPVDIVGNAAENRRTIYGFISRNDVPSMLTMFDFADLDATTAQRPHTVVPQQALFMMNSPFILRQSAQLAERVRRATGDDTAAIRELYRRILAREPNEKELAASAAFMQRSREAAADQEEKDPSLRQLAQVLFQTNEFLFVD